MPRFVGEKRFVFKAASQARRWEIFCHFFLVLFLFYILNWLNLVWKFWILMLCWLYHLQIFSPIQQAVFVLSTFCLFVFSCKKVLCLISFHLIILAFVFFSSHPVSPLPDTLQTGESETAVQLPAPFLGLCSHQLFSTSPSAHPVLPFTGFSFFFMLFQGGFLLVPTLLWHQWFPELGPRWVCVLRRADVQHCGLAAGTEIQSRVRCLGGVDFQAAGWVLVALSWKSLFEHGCIFYNFFIL